MKRNSMSKGRGVESGKHKSSTDTAAVVIASISFLMAYGATYFILSSYIPTERTFHMMSIPDYNRIIFIHIVSITLSAVSAYIVYSAASGGQETMRDDEGSEIKRIYRLLTKDEKAALNEIRRSKSISQDSLRFRMGWSKAKTSSVVTRLEKYRLIQRERIGKTYRLIPEI